MQPSVALYLLIVSLCCFIYMCGQAIIPSLVMYYCTNHMTHVFLEYRHVLISIPLYRKLDYSVISHGLMDHVIRSQVYGSDHCPIVLLITL